MIEISHPELATNTLSTAPSHRSVENNKIRGKIQFSFKHIVTCPVRSWDFSKMMDGTTEGPPQDATRRLQPKKQTLDDAYAAPANFLEIDVLNPITHGMTRKRYTDYEVRLRVSLASKYIILIAFVHFTELKYEAL